MSDALTGILVNQNQFDALFSFCYNLGVGALFGSILYRKLEDDDFHGAATEFPRWNKGHEHGVEVVLPGPVTRRAREQALFEKMDLPGTLVPAAESGSAGAVTAKGFRQDNINFLVTYKKDNTPFEILKFSDSSPVTIAAALKTYPKLQSFDFARPNEQVPNGPRIAFSDLAPIIV